MITTIIGSIGFILAIMSFITGLQILRGNAETAKKMHRLNGYLAIVVFFTFAAMIVFGGGRVKTWLLIAWIAGLLLTFLKLWVVRNKRTYKYASQVGFFLMIAWIIVIVQYVR